MTATLTRFRTLIAAALLAAVFVVIFRQFPTVIAAELAFTPEAFRLALAQWKQEFLAAPVLAMDAVAAFRLTVGIDFLFIPTYATLLATVYLRLRGISSHPTGGGLALGRFDRVVLGGCGVAAVLDVLENVGLLALTWNVTEATAGSTSFPALVVGAMSTASAGKWATIALVVAASIGAIVFRRKNPAQ